MMQYQQTKFRQQQLAVQKIQASGMAEYHKAQAENLRRKTMGGSLADIQLMNSMAKGEHMDPSVMKPLLKDRMETFLSSAKPEEKLALSKHMDAQIQAGQVPSEIAGDISVNANQLRYMQSVQGNQTKKDVAGTQAAARTQSAETAAGARVESAKEYGRTRIGVAKTAADAKESSDYGIKSQVQDLNKRMAQTHQAMLNLDKPPAPGMLPMDDKAKSSLQEHYTSEINGLSKQRDQLINGAPAEAPKAAQPSQTYTQDQWKQAKPGDFVKDASGNLHQAVDGGFIPAEPMGPPAPGGS